MSGPIVCRALAVAIAVAGVVDPRITLSRARPTPLTIVATDAVAATHVEHVRRALAGSNAAGVRVHAHASRGAACPSDGACVLVSSGTRPNHLTAGALVFGGVLIPRREGQRVETVDLDPRVSLHAASSMTVRLAQSAKSVRVSDAGVPVGMAANVSDSAVVEWMPLAAGVRRLRVDVEGDHVDVGTVVDEKPVPVVFAELESTWAATFVRRALEDDPRFAVDGRTLVAPRVAVARGRGTSLPSLDDETRVVIVAAPDRLSEAEVDRLERFVANRGGSLVLLPDGPPRGPIARLMPVLTRQHALSAPTQIGPLMARELLHWEATTLGEDLGGTEDGPVMLASPHGRGRVIVSGALDAWRFRQSSPGFARFWTSLVWRAAQASGVPLEVTTPQVLIAPGEELAVDVAMQSSEAMPFELSAEGRFECPAERGPLRLWPRGRPGEFSGTFRPTSTGECRLTASVAGQTGSTSVLVATDIVRPPPPAGAFAAAVGAHGGVVVPLGRAAELASRVQSRAASAPTPIEVHPMRSPWWLVPFVACLTVEWAWRRRAGLR